MEILIKHPFFGNRRGWLGNRCRRLTFKASSLKRGGRLLLGVLLLFASACADMSAYRYRQMYALASPAENYDRVFEDKNLAFRFEVKEKKIEVFITNKSLGNVSLNWPEVRYIDSSNEELEVANMQTLFTKNMGKIKPTLLKPGVTEENLIVPIKNVEKLEQWTWAVKPFFNQEDEGALLNRGKTFGLLFPVELGTEGESISKLYTFRFKVTNVVPFRTHTPR